MKLKTFVQGCGAAILLMISHLAALISPYHAVLYHSILPMRSVVWGTLIDLEVLSLLAACVLSYLEKRPSGLRAFLWILIAAWLARIIARNLPAYLRWHISSLTVAMIFVVVFTASLALWWLQPPAYRTAVRGLLALLFIAGCNAIWMVPELVHQGLRAQHTEPVVPLSSPAPASHRVDLKGRGPRIVWLLFDELSYDQTFDHRYPGLAMPAFDRLKSKSIVFSDLKPEGFQTDLVIPSFFLGRSVEKIRSGLDGYPMLRMAGSTQWQAFDARATVFADARRLGWTTGVVGWFNPYCRILAGTVDSCFWRMGDGELKGPISTKSPLENAISPFQNMIWQLRRKPVFTQQIHAADLSEIMAAATALIRDQSISFVYIHLPIPHPPGIYDRKTGTLRATGSYIDNLALSDRVLDELMRSLNATALASETTVIVCSDHSWRLSIWRPSPFWTKEDEIAGKGHFDPRPVLMIHYPGQQVAHDVTEPFEAIRIHQLIEEMLRGEEPGVDEPMLPGSVRRHGAAGR